MKEAEAYLRAVRRGLTDAPAEDRERLMKRLTEAVHAYLDEDPEAGEADIVKAFGSPEDCAAELLEECGPARVAAVRRKRRRKLYVVITILAVLLALAAVWSMSARSGTPNIPAAESAYHEEHSGHGSGHH